MYLKKEILVIKHRGNEGWGEFLCKMWYASLFSPFGKKGKKERDTRLLSVYPFSCSILILTTVVEPSENT